MGIYRQFRALALTAAAAVSVAAVPVLTSTAVAKEPVRLAPSSKWVVKYENESCRMMRRFGEGKDRSIFFAERYEPTKVLSVVVAGKHFGSTGSRSLKSRNQRSNDVTLTFGPDAEPIDRSFLRGEFSDYGGALVISYVTMGKGSPKLPLSKDLEQQEYDPLTDQQEDSVEWLLVENASKNAVLLELGPMKAPMEAMRKCTDNLIRTWGLDPEQQANLSKAVEPTNNVSSWVTTNDYPKSMVRKGYEGLVNARMAVNEKGEATGCKIQQSTRPQEFDDAVCKSLSKRARFSPAIAANGEPVASYYRISVRFQLPY